MTLWQFVYAMLYVGCMVVSALIVYAVIVVLTFWPVAVVWWIVRKWHDRRR